MSGWCVECGSRQAVIRDPRETPVSVEDPCLCSDCGEGALIEVIERAQETVDDAVEELRQLNPESWYLSGYSQADVDEPIEADLGPRRGAAAMNDEWRRMYETMTVECLRKLCKKRGIKVGKQSKDDLIEALCEWTRLSRQPQQKKTPTP